MPCGSVGREFLGGRCIIIVIRSVGYVMPYSASIALSRYEPSPAIRGERIDHLSIGPLPLGIRRQRHPQLWPAIVFAIQTRHDPVDSQRAVERPVGFGTDRRLWQCWQTSC